MVISPTDTTLVRHLAPHLTFSCLNVPNRSQTAKKKMTASSIYFQSFPYGIHAESNLINYDSLTSQARLFKPKLIICGASAYPRDWDYGKLRTIANEHGAFLMADIAHTSGLIAAGELDNPFEFCDVVTTTTYVDRAPATIKI